MEMENAHLVAVIIQSAMINIMYIHVCTHTSCLVTTNGIKILRQQDYKPLPMYFLT